MELTLPNIIIMIAAAQGLLLSALILQIHRALFANRYLALLMLSYTAVLAHLVLQDTGLYAVYPFLFLLSGLSLASMPLHYLYTRHLIVRSERYQPRELVHFLPFVLYELVLSGSIVSGTLDLTLAGTVSATETPLLLRIYNISVIVLAFGYLTPSLRLIKRYDAHVKDVVSSIESLQLTWLRNITLTGIAAVSLFAVEEFFLVQGYNLTNFILSSVGFALYVYGMGYMGLLKSGIFADRAAERTMQTVEEISAAEEGNTAVKYERSGLTDAVADHVLASLQTMMAERKIYRNSTLTLTELAETLSVSPHNLSEVINTRTKMNFYDLVNGYRLDEVKKDLTDPAKQHLKILSIAFDAGFNSKATFNTLFKQQTGKTPSEYRNGVIR